MIRVNVNILKYSMGETIVVSVQVILDDILMSCDRRYTIGLICKTISRGTKVEKCQPLHPKVIQLNLVRLQR